MCEHAFIYLCSLWLNFITRQALFYISEYCNCLRDENMKLGSHDMVMIEKVSLWTTNYVFATRLSIYRHVTLPSCTLWKLPFLHNSCKIQNSSSFQTFWSSCLISKLATCISTISSICKIFPKLASHGVPTVMWLQVYNSKCSSECLNRKCIREATYSWRWCGSDTWLGAELESLSDVSCENELRAKLLDPRCMCLQI